MIFCEAMKSSERRLRLLELFARQEFASAEELCAKLEVSDSTVRRDLMELEAEGVLKRVHGGALALHRDESLDIRRRASVEQDEKSRIGTAAAALVQDGQTVMMGGGSTVVQAARG